MSPSRFRRLSYEDKIEMIAADRTVEDMEAVNQDMAVREARTNNAIGQMKRRGNRRRR